MKTDRFTEMGIASLLPGMRYLADQMQEQIRYMEQALAAHQETREEVLEPKRRGRPPGSRTTKGAWAGMTAQQRRVEMRRRQKLAAERKAAGLGPTRRTPMGKSWANMTAEERSAEMRRRQAISRAKLLAGAGASHPRDPRHPGHAEWVAKLSKANKKAWGAMSAAARKKRVKRLVEGRHPARKEAAKEALVNGAA